jgi:hypothetical protein
VLAWEAIKHLHFPGPGHTYLGVVIQDDKVHGIALRKYVTTLELAIRGADVPVEMVFYTPSQVFHHVCQAVEALHAVNLVHVGLCQVPYGWSSSCLIFLHAG